MGGSRCYPKALEQEIGCGVQYRHGHYWRDLRRHDRRVRDRWQEALDVSDPVKQPPGSGGFALRRAHRRRVQVRTVRQPRLVNYGIPEVVTVPHRRLQEERIGTISADLARPVVWFEVASQPIGIT